MRRLAPVLLAALAVTPPAFASGFTAADLRRVEGAAVRALGPACLARAEAERLTLTCPDRPGAPIVDLRLGRQDDGTEARVRSGATTVADLERLCREREPACRLSPLDVAPAVGWVSSWPMGDGAGATSVVLRDGDLLTVRALAATPEAARAAIDALLPVVRAGVVGE